MEQRKKVGWSDLIWSDLLKRWLSEDDKPVEGVWRSAGTLACATGLHVAEQVHPLMVMVRRNVVKVLPRSSNPSHLSPICICRMCWKSNLTDGIYPTGILQRSCRVGADSAARRRPAADQADGPNLSARISVRIRSFVGPFGEMSISWPVSRQEVRNSGQEFGSVGKMFLF